MNKDLYDQLIQRSVTMVTEERFETILYHENRVSSLTGDIVECGVWNGGMSIFLSKLFFNKNMWVCDSFEGCQDPTTGKYQYEQETHTRGMYSAGLDSVKENFKNFDALDEPRVSFLQGYVKDTLEPSVCPIKQIALLRIDVDAYSATLEVLDYLYDKVVSGGIVIFDDSCLQETRDAIIKFTETHSSIEIKDPVSHESIELTSDNNLPCGCYFIKS